MKIAQKSITAVFLLSFVASVFNPVNAVETDIVQNQTSAINTDVVKVSSAVTSFEEYIGDNRSFQNAADKIAVKVSGEISGDNYEIHFNVNEKGIYSVALEGAPSDVSYSDIQLSFLLDGKLPFEEASNVTVRRLWADVGDIRTDGLGNEFAAEQAPYSQEESYYPYIESCESNLLLDLEPGAHKLTVNSIKGKFKISSLTLHPLNDVAEYKAPENKNEYYTGQDIIYEAEKSLWKNSRWLIAQSDNSSSLVHPYDPYKSKINYIGGDNWEKVGDTIAWEINAPNDGYYRLEIDYRQDAVINYNSYRSLKIDGVAPFAQAESISFPYKLSWQKKVLSDKDGNPYLIYLTEGKHTLSLTVSTGEYSEIIEKLKKVISQLGDMHLEMTMITGETVDISRDYDLFALIPDFEKRLKACSDELGDISNKMDVVSGRKGGSYESVVRNMKRVVDEMLNNKYSATKYKSNYYSNYTSLSQCVNDMQDMPLDIDRIILAAPDSEVKKSSGNIFKKAFFSVSKFIASFINDYEGISGVSSEDNAITLWVNWGRDQARVLNDMISSDFTAETGIPVNVHMVNASIVQAILSGNGPDVVLQQARTEPVNLAMRGALYDLTNFDDYEQVLGRFANGAATPYYYRDGLYALPDTQSFTMLFYREDILNKFGLKVPETWDDLIEIIKVLARNNLSVGMPHSQISDNGQASAGTGILSLLPTLLLQRDIPLYSEDMKSTNLSSPKVLETFDFWTDFYTKLKLDISISFYNRFRDGTCPIGLSSYTLAVTLLSEAPELDGLWKMAPIPGTKLADGSISHASAGGGTGCSILEMSENKHQAWEFLKWWTEAETQADYSMNLESILGPLGRVSVSNIEAFKKMPWSDEHLAAILDAWEQVEEYPELPGGYQVARSIDMAFYSVANSNKSSKDMLIKWGEEADKEIIRKYNQYKNR